MKNVDNTAKSMQVGLSDKFIRGEIDEDLSEKEKNDSQSLKRRSAEFMKSETGFKSKLCSNAVKET